MNKTLLYIDFESYYDSKTFTLKKLSMIEYVRSPEFKAFGLAYAHGNNPIIWVTGSQIPKFCSMIANGPGWPNVVMVSHNVKFDATILREVYECVPGQFVCTKAMSKAVFAKSSKGHSLADLAEHFGLKSKGIMKTDGLRELTAEQEAELATYCIHDVELCRSIYKKLVPQFPESQYEAMHRTVSMFVNSKLQLNVPLLEKTAKEEAARRETIFKEIGIDKKEFASNAKFPKLLQSEGYDVPTKVSPRTGKTIPALALGDPEFLEMAEEGNERLKTLCEARIAAKSTLLETRSAKLAAIGATGRWPFDVEFSGADQTHRFSGGSGAGGNPQNFTRDSALREAVEAPEGYSLVVGDFSNIELRIVAYLSRDAGLVQAIENGVDLYCDFASVFYGRKINKADAKERRFGKCLAEGTIVITDHGNKAIETITAEDKVWDGRDFVRHGGLIDNGIKEVTSWGGLWLTPDHRVLCGTEWWEAQSVVLDANRRSRALETASERLQLLDTSKGREAELLASFESAIAADRNGWLMLRTSNAEERPVATSARSSRGQRNDTGNMRPLLELTPIELDSSTVYRRLSPDATIKKIGCISTTENEEYGFILLGETTGQSFCAIFKRFQGGTTRLLKWIEPTSISAIYQEMYGLSLAPRISLISDGSKTSKRVFDISNAGWLNRFAVLTADGPIVVHNCAILGLGYGMGATKFAKTVRLQTGETLTEEQARKAVDLYRTRYGGVPRLWEFLDKSIVLMMGVKDPQPGVLPVVFGKEAVQLPSGLKLRYPNLRQVVDGRHTEWVYDVYNKRNLEQRKLYGGKSLENISQALAGEITKLAMERMGDCVVGQCHDELICVAKKGLESVVAAKLKRAMTISPSWLPEIKLECEIGVGGNWNEAK